jgi:iron complex outermembrane receptor protein
MDQADALDAMGRTVAPRDSASGVPQTWRRIWPRLLVSALLVVLQAAAPAQDAPGKVAGKGQDLTNLSIEDLANVEVTSASKKVERLSDTSAAVYVITAEDIRRSGLTSIPELLRMVPGMSVAHINASLWAIGSRGFNERFSKMMLVLIDGRTVYDNAFSGVSWDAQDTLIEDIDRIEVIRGPGAAIWGANAVTGVVNIITKKASATQGGKVFAIDGDEERPLGGIRYGGKIGQTGAYRVYAKGFNRTDFKASNGTPADDDWTQKRAGFRMDWPGENSYSLHGDIYHGRQQDEFVSPTTVPPYAELVRGSGHATGGYLLGRWDRHSPNGSEMSLQTYFDRSEHTSTQVGALFDTADVEFQNRSLIGSRHELIWGLGYRHTVGELRGSATVHVPADRETNRVASAFFQDDISLVPARWKLTIGSKLEHNDYTGYEVEPNIRLQHTIDPHHSLWASASRAVRTPSQGERAARQDLFAFPTDQGTYLVSLVGNPNLKAETEWAYEMGYRMQRHSASLDVCGFYNVYNDLRATEMGTPFSEGDHIVIPLLLVNRDRAHSYGIEVTGRWMPSARWTLSANCSWFEFFEEEPSSASDGQPALPTGIQAKNHFNLQSHLDFGEQWEFDAWLNLVSRVQFGPLNGTDAPLAVAGYARLDLRLGWRPRTDLELSFGVRNLLQSSHQEFGSGLGEVPTEVPRTFFVKATLSF